MAQGGVQHRELDQNVRRNLDRRELVCPKHALCEHRQGPTASTDRTLEVVLIFIGVTSTGGFPHRGFENQSIAQSSGRARS